MSIFCEVQSQGLLLIILGATKLKDAKYYRMLSEDSKSAISRILDTIPSPEVVHILINFLHH